MIALELLKRIRNTAGAYTPSPDETGLLDDLEMQRLIIQSDDGYRLTERGTGFIQGYESVGSETQPLLSMTTPERVTFFINGTQHSAAQGTLMSYEQISFSAFSQWVASQGITVQYYNRLQQVSGKLFRGDFVTLENGLVIDVVMIGPGW